MHAVLIDYRASLPQIIIAFCDRAKCCFAALAHRQRPGSEMGTARKWGRERILLRGIPRQELEFAPVPDYPPLQIAAGSGVKAMSITKAQITRLMMGMCVICFRPANDRTDRRRRSVLSDLQAGVARCVWSRDRVGPHSVFAINSCFAINACNSTVANCSTCPPSAS